MGNERVAVVTGGGRGMGRAIALAFARKGHRVVVASRTEADTEETAALGGSAVHAFACDVSDPKQVEELFEFTEERCGRVDVLVCSHGVYMGGADALELPIEQFDQTMAINLRGVLLCAQRAGRMMRDAGEGGRMVFISSMNGAASQTHALDYDVSKAAVNALARALAVELGRDGITVNAIAPGWIRTEMSVEEVVQFEQQGLVVNPLGEIGTPEQIAGAAIWLSDEDSGFVTGSVVTIDGGQTAMLPMPWDPSGTAVPESPGPE